MKNNTLTSLWEFFSGDPVPTEKSIFIQKITSFINKYATAIDKLTRDSDTPYEQNLIQEHYAEYDRFFSLFINTMFTEYGKHWQTEKKLNKVSIKLEKLWDKLTKKNRNVETAKYINPESICTVRLRKKRFKKHSFSEN